MKLTNRVMFELLKNTIVESPNPLFEGLRLETSIPDTMTVITDIQDRKSLIAQEGNNSLDETDQLLHAIGEIATDKIECIKGQLVCEGLATEKTHVVLWLEGRQIPSELCNVTI